MERLMQIAKPRARDLAWINPACIFKACPYLVARITPNGNLVEVSRHMYFDDARIATMCPVTRGGRHHQTFVFHLGVNKYTGTWYPLDGNLVPARKGTNWSVEDILRREG